jgi:hypothetical protein
MVSVSAHGRASTLVSPRLRTKAPHSLLLAFVVARGDAPGEHVRRISAAGLRWSPVVRGGGGTGATEVWQARARHWWSGRIVASLAAGAYPASVTIVAYGGASPYVARHAARQGHGSTPNVRLRPVAGSLVWTVGLSAGQGTPAIGSTSPSRRVLLRTFEPHHRTGEWIELATAKSSAVATAAGASRARAWSMVAVDVVVPSLKRLIEKGLLTPYGFLGAATKRPGVPLPPYCAPNPAFEVGVEDDPVFLGLQPAMSPARGFELATNVFHARLLRLNVIWGQVKRYGWGPYDRAVQMARERCWAVQMTIMPTPSYDEGYLNSELSARHFSIGLFASFATEIATRYAGQVTRLAIDNEPDGASYIPPGGNLSSHMAFYDNLYMASYRAVRSANPGVQILAGELSGLNISEWLTNVAALPSDGVGVHPYGLTSDIGKFVRLVAPVPLLVTEYGVAASHPTQIQQDLEREEGARREGAHAFIFYQLSRADTGAGGGWNTGIE